MSDLLHWEDFGIGEVATFGEKHVERDEIIAFAREFDPQPFHIDEAAAARSMLGGLAASGWHSCAMAMRMICDGYLLRSTSKGSPGLEEVRWIEPVRPGDVLRVRMTCLDKRGSGSRADAGLCRFLYEVLNQRDQVVMTWDCMQLFGRREPATPDEMGTVPKRVPKRDEAIERITGDHMIKFFEDIELGDELDLGRYKFTAQRIRDFARLYDPQDFHLDDAAARASIFGELCASGWHTAAVWMRQMIRYIAREAARLSHMGRPVPQLGVSPGFRDLRWLKPVYAGADIHYRSYAAHKIEVSKPGWGLLVTRNEGYDPSGELVFSFLGQVYMQRRPG